MSAITISREMGSLGCQVAQVLGQRLGYRVVWREAINQAAIRAGAPEVALAVIDELDLLGLRPDPQALQAYLAAIAQVMRELADAGRVILVGRAGQAILRGRADVYHVRVTAPYEVRAVRLAESKGLALPAARAQVAASDRSRSRYLKRSYSIRWDDPDLYDLVVNTEHISPHTAGDLIYRAFVLRFSPELIPTSEANIEFECD